MKKRGRLFALVLLMTAVLVLSPFAMPQKAFAATHDEDTMARLHGTWKGTFTVWISSGVITNDQVTLNIVNGDGEDGKKLYLTIQSSDADYIEPKTWSTSDGSLDFTYNSGKWESRVSLSFDGVNTLTGSYEQYDSTSSVTLKRTSTQPTDWKGRPNYTFESLNDAESLKILQANAKYGGGKVGVQYRYEMGSKEPIKAFIKENGIDELLQAKTTDAQRMLALMNFVCDTFKHDGESGMPEKQDTMSVINYAKKRGSIECRGLSIILSDLCRAYGIPAKSIKGGPSPRESASCHVVVHAYSSELQQWIMLDPTYRLVLQNEAGQYMNLPMLREALVKGEKFIPNENAGRNRRPFYMDFYRAYMTANTFHFTSATDFYNGSEGEEEKAQYTLVPANFSAGYAYYHYAKPTYSADEFWKTPEVL